MQLDLLLLKKKFNENQVKYGMFTNSRPYYQDNKTKLIEYRTTYEPTIAHKKHFIDTRTRERVDVYYLK